MCFYINNLDPNPLVAQKDITCYKVMDNMGAHSGYYRSLVYPKQNNDYYFHIADTMIPDKLGLPIEYERDYQGEYKCVNHGIHSKITIFNAMNMAYPKNYEWYDRAVIKCIIQKGTTFYQNLDTMEYVSEKLILNQEVKGLKFLFIKILTRIFHKVIS